MKKIGIIGGGQLGKMMILDGKRLDYRFHILDPAFHCPAHGISDRHIVAEFDDIEAIRRLAEGVDLVTYEFEHISVEALREVEQMGIPVYPSSRTLSLIQDKYRQKQCMREHKIPVADFQLVKSPEDIADAGARFGYPLYVKTCTGGYDGKGNFLLKSEAEAADAFAALGGGRLALMAEQEIPSVMEVSVLACRSTTGEIQVFPAAENCRKNSILDEILAPARISRASEKEAMDTAVRCLEVFDVVGMLCVELFVTGDGHVCVNELTLNPHNSGHYTVEGCVTSQYEQHLRAILGLKLGNPSLLRPTAMKNIIGDHEGYACVHGLSEAYENPDVKVHIYGKEQVKPGRKMGHITAGCDTIEEALAQVRNAHKAIWFSDEEDA